MLWWPGSKFQAIFFTNGLVTINRMTVQDLAFPDPKYHVLYQGSFLKLRNVFVLN